MIIMMRRLILRLAGYYLRTSSAMAVCAYSAVDREAWGGDKLSIESSPPRGLPLAKARLCSWRLSFCKYQGLLQLCHCGIARGNNYSMSTEHQSDSLWKLFPFDFPLAIASLRSCL